MISLEQKDQFLRAVRSTLRIDRSGTTLLNAIRGFVAQGMDERTVTKLLGVVQKELHLGEDEVFLGIMDVIFGYAGIGQAIFPEPHYDFEVVNKARPLRNQVSKERMEEFQEIMMSALRAENPREQILLETRQFSAIGMNQAAILWCLLLVDKDADFQHWDTVWEVIKLVANI